MEKNLFFKIESKFLNKKGFKHFVILSRLSLICNERCDSDLYCIALMRSRIWNLALSEVSHHSRAVWNQILEELRLWGEFGQELAKMKPDNKIALL